MSTEDAYSSDKVERQHGEAQRFSNEVTEIMGDTPALEVLSDKELEPSFAGYLAGLVREGVAGESLTHFRQRPDSDQIFDVQKFAREEALPGDPGGNALDVALGKHGMNVIGEVSHWIDANASDLDKSGLVLDTILRFMDRKPREGAFQLSKLRDGNYDLKAWQTWWGNE